jgi:hypothetical protein
MFTYLAQQPQELEAAVVDFQLRRTGKAAEAVGEVVEQIEEVLRHGMLRSCIELT